MKIDIPDMALVLLVGSSGSGKSTFAAKHFLPTEIVSSDRARGVVCDDETSMAATATIICSVEGLRTSLSGRTAMIRCSEMAGPMFWSVGLGITQSRCRRIWRLKSMKALC